MVPPIRAGIAKVRTGRRFDGRYRTGALGGLLRWAMEPPIRMRVPTQPEFVPGADLPKRRTLAEFDRWQEEIADLARAADGADLNRVSITSPFDRRVRYNAYAALRIVLAHERRHLWQAERVAAALGR